MSHGRYTNLILFENLFKPRQLYLQLQNSVLSNLWLAS
ncbi:DNA alkylation repair protein [Streptococcus pneumoniae]|nr:DNA alkylation repair protein [Streptococcus pneumoniae]PHP24487.1 DNA alkylation repair protein [Streptococcus pneumoniae]